MSIQPGWSLRCKIWLSGKSGRHPAGWKSNLHFVSSMIQPQRTSFASLRSDVDSAGLVAALQDLVEREIWKTPCRLEVKPSFRLEHDTAAAHLFRIAPI